VCSRHDAAEKLVGELPLPREGSSHGHHSPTPIFFYNYKRRVFFLIITNAELVAGQRLEPQNGQRNMGSVRAGTRLQPSNTSSIFSFRLIPNKKANDKFLQKISLSIELNEYRAGTCHQRNIYDSTIKEL
jgi:hypothetical protein